MIGSAKEVLQV